MCCLGEGLMNTNLVGPGIIYLSSMPLGLFLIVFILF